MSLGLALQRLDRSDAARAAFDTALTYFPPAERARLDAYERVLSPADTAGYARASVEDRYARRYAYWMGADPLWSQVGNEPHIEFLARVWYAELRWTVKERGVRGADSDRGDVFVRYGPPNIVAGIGPRAIYGEMADVVTFWLYDSGLMFTFAGAAGYATARIPAKDLALAETFKTLSPVRWDNLAKLRIDSMVVQVARFRAASDSVDVLIAANPHYDSIRATSEVDQPVLGAFWLLEGGTRPVFGDTTRIDDGRVLRWTRRVAPGDYLYRIEASATGGSRASKAMAMVNANTDHRTGFALLGFGASDVLLASRTDGAGPGDRWTARRPLPLAGAIPRGATLSVLWENYEFGARDARADYTVSVAIEREEGARGMLAMQLVGVPAADARVDRLANRFAVSFDRVAVHAPAFADVVDLDLRRRRSGVTRSR
jgi:GWxTD domain-containing protein